MKHTALRLLLGVTTFSLFFLLEGATSAHEQAVQSVEQWGDYELKLNGPTKGNPYLEVTLDAEFTNGQRTVSVPGFYDGNGTYIASILSGGAGGVELRHAEQPRGTERKTRLLAMHCRDREKPRSGAHRQHALSAVRRWIARVLGRYDRLSVGLREADDSGPDTRDTCELAFQQDSYVLFP